MSKFDIILLDAYTGDLGVVARFNERNRVRQQSRLQAAVLEAYEARERHVDAYDPDDGRREVWDEAMEEHEEAVALAWHALQAHIEAGR